MAAARTIQIKRGFRFQMPEQASPGELLFAIDTRELFAGSTNGSVVRLNDVIVGSSKPTLDDSSPNLLWLDTANNQLKRFDDVANDFVDALDVDGDLAALQASFDALINDESISTEVVWSAEKVSAELDTKAEAVHTHTDEDITNFHDAADSIAADQIESQKGEAGGIASLNQEGKVPLTQLPREVKETKVVADIAARDALVDPYESLFVFVIDAAADETVQAGGALYVYDDQAAWVKVSDTESMELVLDWTEIENIPNQAVLEASGLLAFKQEHIDEINARVNKMTSYTNGNILVANPTGGIEDSGHKWEDLEILDGGTF